MNNEPVAYWDGKEPNVLGLAYHQNDYCFIPLYTHPVKEHFEDEPQAEELHEILQSNAELTPCEELRAFQEQQNGVFSDHNACCYRHECRIVWNDWEKLRSNPAELTDEEKWKLWSECPNGLVYDRVMMFADLILRKASEK